MPINVIFVTVNIVINNLFNNKDLPKGEEYIRNIFTAKNPNLIYAEHIVSFGHASPDSFWYDQEETEWVALLKGKSTLKFENNEILELSEGDYITIPKHTRHRVESVSNDAVWLAFFIK